MYQDWLTERGSGPHHIGFQLATRAEFDDAERHYHDCGVVKAQAGVFEAPDGGGCWWAYYDTRAALGC